MKIILILIALISFTACSTIERATLRRDGKTFVREVKTSAFKIIGNVIGSTIANLIQNNQ